MPLTVAGLLTLIMPVTAPPTVTLSEADNHCRFGRPTGGYAHGDRLAGTADRRARGRQGHPGDGDRAAVRADAHLEWRPASPAHGRRHLDRAVGQGVRPAR